MNTQRPTPKTDAEVKRIKSDRSIFVPKELDVLAIFARKLERERDEALATRNDIGSHWQRIATTAEAERDELRKQLEAMREAIKEAYAAIKEAREFVYWDVGTFKALNTTLPKSGPALAKLKPFLKP